MKIRKIRKRARKSLKKHHEDGTGSVHRKLKADTFQEISTLKVIIKISKFILTK